MNGVSLPCSFILVPFSARASRVALFLSGSHPLRICETAKTRGGQTWVDFSPRLKLALTNINIRNVDANNPLNVAIVSTVAASREPHDLHSTFHVLYGIVETRPQLQRCSGYNVPPDFSQLVLQQPKETNDIGVRITITDTHEKERRISCLEGCNAYLAVTVVGTGTLRDTGDGSGDQHPWVSNQKKK